MYEKSSVSKRICLILSDHGNSGSGGSGWCECVRACVRVCVPGCLLLSAVHLFEEIRDACLPFCMLTLIN